MLVVESKQPSSSKLPSKAGLVNPACKLAGWVSATLLQRNLGLWAW